MAVKVAINGFGRIGRNTLRAIIELGQAAGEIRSDIDPNLLEALFEFSFIVAAQAYYRNPADFDRESTITQCVDLFLRGAGTQE